MKARSVALAAACTFALMGVVATPAVLARGGRTPEKVFGGKVLTSNKRFPTSAKSPSAYVDKLRKASTDKFWEDKAKKQWKIYYAAFFRRPINDLEVTVKLYDITTGAKQMVSSFEVYMERRGETSLISYVILERKFFGVNKKILMSIEDYKGRTLASGTFKILGQGERYTGKVNFTEEETKGDIEYSDDDD